jgi:hypothetical protein
MDSAAQDPQKTQLQNPGLEMRPPQVPMQEAPPFAGVDIESLKRQARELAIHQTLAQNQYQMQQTPPQRSASQLPTLPNFAPQPVQQFVQESAPEVIYVRRNLTIAEMIVVFAISLILVSGGQFVFSALSNHLPRLEIKVK